MRIFKLTGALIVVLAFSAIGVATASAAETLWAWLPGSDKETFSGENHPKTPATLQVDGAGAIVCQTTSILLTGSELQMPEGTKKDATLALATVHFTGCKFGEFAVESSGDSPEVILAHLEIHNCVITKAPLVFGLLIKVLPVVLVILPSGLTIEVTGSFVAPVKKTGTSVFLFEPKQTNGLQAVEKCEGGEKETLLSSIDKTTAIESGEEAFTILKFDKAIDKEEVFV